MLDHVRTTAVLFSEHDTPLVGDCPWAGMVDVIASGEARVIRLSSEASILEPWRHLYLDETPVDVAGVPLLRTVQWSSRPHLADTEWYRQILHADFGDESRTFTEDVLHRVVQSAHKRQGEDGWREWRIWTYAPAGDLKRSEHTDGRDGASKGRLTFAYPGGGPPPPGAPATLESRRGESRSPRSSGRGGLARQSFEWWRHVPGCRPLVIVNRASESQGFEQHPEWYGEAATVVEVDTRRWLLPERTVRRWLTTVDIVYAPETLYDWRLADWARKAGARTVVHINPEFWKDRDPMPDALWSPTGWRLDRLPEGTTVVPVPVALEDYPEPATLDLDERVRVLHVVGHAAAGDRAGTSIVGEATRRLPGVDWTVRSQDRGVTGSRSRYRWTIEPGGMPDHRDLFAGFHVLAHPRRYGGLSLVTQEALAAGLAVVMPDCSPNGEWPIVPVPVRRRGVIVTAAGRIDTADVLATDLALAISDLASDRGRLLETMAGSRRWAEENSWTALLPAIWDEPDRIVSS